MDLEKMKTLSRVNHIDAFQVALLTEASRRVNAALAEANALNVKVKSIYLYWLNVADTEKNPLREVGHIMVRATGTVSIGRRICYAWERTLRRVVAAIRRNPEAWLQQEQRGSNHEFKPTPAPEA
jgi:hypothetical protein